MVDTTGAMALAQNDTMNVRMEGLILRALVERNILTMGEARDLIQDVIDHAPQMAALSPAYAEMRDQFR